jgi:hypothetical protein
MKKFENEEDCHLKYIRFINNDEATVEAFVNEYDKLLLDNSQYV